MVTFPELSVATAVPVAAGNVDPPQLTVLLAGHVITGFTLSIYGAEHGC